MSGYVNRILTAMHPDIYYRPCDISSQTGIQVGEVAKALKMLHEGGLVELERGTEYRRKKIYRSKQRGLPL